jgi:MoxR-like ATPase
MAEKEKSCANCPSFLKTEDTVGAFRTSIGAPMCKRFGFVLGRPGLSPAGEAAVQQVRAKDCTEYMKGAPGAPLDYRHEVAFFDANIPVGPPELDDQDSLVTSCLMCKNYIPETVVMDELGWPAGMCAIKGKLLLKGRTTYEARNCEYKKFGENRRDTHGIQLLQEFEDAFVLSGDKNDVAVFLAEQRNLIDPREYPTDAPVSAPDIEAGIRAWRKIIDPEKEDRHIFLPIYDLDRLTPSQRERVPITGDDEHPEDYADHMGIVYKAAVLWRMLDETPALWGVAGTGKTEFYRHLAWLMCLPFTRISVTASTELDDLFGKMHLRDGKTVFEYGRLPKAWTEPNVIVLDEPNTGPPDVWQAIRPLTDNSKQLALDMNEGEILPRNDDCYLGLAMNPAWDIRNIGATELGDADGSRLMHIEMQLPSPGIEKEIMRKRCEHDGYRIPDAVLGKIQKIAKDIRDQSDSGTIPISWGIRPQIKVARATNWFSLVSAYRMAAADLLEPEVRQVIIDIVKQYDDDSDPWN